MQFAQTFGKEQFFWTIPAGDSSQGQLGTKQEQLGTKEELKGTAREEEKKEQPGTKQGRPWIKQGQDHNWSNLAS